VFWDVHDTAKTVIVTLEHEGYRKLIVQVEDPAATLAQPRAVLPRTSS